MKGTRLGLAAAAIGVAVAPASAQGEEVRAIFAQASAMHQEARQLEDETAALRDAIDRLVADFDSYRERYRLHARISAVGESLGTLECTNGRSYKEAVVRRVTDVGLEIRHAGGSARVPYHCLPESFRDRFQWSETEAAAVLAREERDQLLREQVAAVAMERKKERDAAIAAEVARLDDRIASLSSQLARVSSRTSRLETSGRLGERRTVGTSYHYYGSPYRSSRYSRSNRYSNSYCYPSSPVASGSPTPTYRPASTSSWCPSSTPRRIVISKSSSAPTRTSSPYVPTP